VAAAFLSRGYIAEAGELFERALRYVPDSAEAVAGLARSLKALGQGRRSLDLLARSAALASRKGQAAHGIQIELARGLAEVADDRPAAIARG
jgi:thioredoxin-like negative regulator of GroEL